MGLSGPLIVFFCCSLPPKKCRFRFQVSFLVPGVWCAKKTPVQIQPKHAGKHSPGATRPLDLRKTSAEWRNMLQNMFPHSRGKGFLFDVLFILVGARPSANKM